MDKFKMFVDQAKEPVKVSIELDGSVHRLGGTEAEMLPVKVFLGMEVGRYDGCEWGFIFNYNSDDTVSILIPFKTNFSEIYTRCVWDDQKEFWYADGECVTLDDGAVML